MWFIARPETTLIQLQRQILDNNKTLERVVAHEMVHHAEFIELGPEDVAKLKIGIRPPSHGKRFHELAAQINAATRPDFVTEGLRQFVRHLAADVPNSDSQITRWKLGLRNRRLTVTQDESQD